MMSTKTSKSSISEMKFFIQSFIMINQIFLKIGFS